MIHRIETTVEDSDFWRLLTNPLQGGRPENRLLPLLGLLLLTACQDTSTADGVAQAFVDAYYIEFSHEKAKTFTVGPATRRLDKELALVSMARQRLRVEPNKARVYYEKPKRRALDKSRVHFTFDLDVRRGTSKFSRTVFVMTTLRDGKWKVLGFREEGEPAPGKREIEAVGTSTSP